MIQRWSGALSRRSLVGGSLGASVLAAVGLGAETSARSEKNRVGAQACIASGKKCPSKKPRGKKKKKLGCNQCCEGRSVTVTNSKGKQVQKCGCHQMGTACTTETECCSNVCANGFCQIAPCAALGQPCAFQPGFGSNVCCLNGPLSGTNAVFCTQSLMPGAPPTTPGTCVACVPAGGACNIALDPTQQCCGANVCIDEGPGAGTCGVPTPPPPG
jgi:hypothetical protein